MRLRCLETFSGHQQARCQHNNIISHLHVETFLLNGARLICVTQNVNNMRTFTSDRTKACNVKLG